MRFFIGYLIEGEARKWHQALTGDISEKFNVWKIEEKIPSHITIFRPFEIENIKPISELLENWKEEKIAFGKFTISGFGRFDDRVVFAEVKPDQITKDIVSDLRLKLQSIPGVQPEDYQAWRPHATIAYKVEPAKINAIWNYVSTLQKPQFKLAFNNIAILQYKGDGQWAVFQKLDLRSYASGSSS